MPSVVCSRAQVRCRGTSGPSASGRLVVPSGRPAPWPGSAVKATACPSRTTAGAVAHLRSGAPGKAAGPQGGGDRRGAGPQPADDRFVGQVGDGDRPAAGQPVTGADQDVATLANRSRLSKPGPGTGPRHSAMSARPDRSRSSWSSTVPTHARTRAAGRHRRRRTSRSGRTAPHPGLVTVTVEDAVADRRAGAALCAAWASKALPSVSRVLPAAVSVTPCGSRTSHRLGRLPRRHRRVTGRLPLRRARPRAGPRRSASGLPRRRLGGDLPRRDRRLRGPSVAVRRGVRAARVAGRLPRLRRVRPRGRALPPCQAGPACGG